jgi:hypothetical protein
MRTNLMDPRDLSTSRWTSPLEKFNESQLWSAQLDSVQDAASKLDSVTDRIDRIQTTLTSGMADASAIYDSIPDTTKLVAGSMPVASTIYDSIPDVSKMILDAVPSVTGMATEPVPSWMKGSQVAGGVAHVTGGLALDRVQSASAALTNLGVASKSPVYGGTFYAGTKQPATVIPRSLLQREPWESSSRRAPLTDEPIPDQAPQVLPQELGEEIAPRVARRQRQEVKGLLVLLGLDFALENLESVERRLLDGRRPERVQAALSASLLLTDLADKLFPAREAKRKDLNGIPREVGAENVKNRLLAFAEPYFEDRPVEEHKLLVAELDFIYRWTGKGHHVAFSRTENEEAYCALLKALAIIARAHR